MSYTLEELVSLWRTTAKKLREMKDISDTMKRLCASIYENCADELEEIIGWS